MGGGEGWLGVSVHSRNYGTVQRYTGQEVVHSTQGERWLSLKSAVDAHL